MRIINEPARGKPDSTVTEYSGRGLKGGTAQTLPKGKGEVGNMTNTVVCLGGKYEPLKKWGALAAHTLGGCRGISIMVSRREAKPLPPSIMAEPTRLAQIGEFRNAHL